jgi:hypothetical protein
VASAARGDLKFGWTFAQALDPERPARLSRSERWAFEWHWSEPAGEAPSGGMIAACGDVHAGESWWFLHTDGLYRSDDAGRTRRRVAVP